MRIILAIQCFFALLFAGRLPRSAAKALPAPEEAAEPKGASAEELADAKKRVEGLEQELAEVRRAQEAAEKAKGELEEQVRSLEAAKASAEEARGAAEDGRKKVEERAEQAKEAAKAAEDKLKKARDDGALALLAWLQREGRLIDFLREAVDDYEDEQVGAAVRAIHSGCRKVLDEGFDLRPVLEGEEGAQVEVPEGFDPVAISLSGSVHGDPPYEGALMHHGWRTESVAVPVPETVDPRVLAPAEVEL